MAGRPRAEDDLPQIADLAARGLTMRAIAEQTGKSYSQVRTRITALRRAVAHETGEIAWLEERTVVEVAQRWLTLFAPEAQEP